MGVLYDNMLGGKVKVTNSDAARLAKGITVDHPEVPVEVSNIYRTLVEETKNDGFILPSAYSFPNARAPWKWSILEWSTGDPNTLGGAHVADVTPGMIDVFRERGDIPNILEKAINRDGVDKCLVIVPLIASGGYTTVLPSVEVIGQDVNGSYVGNHTYEKDATSLRDNDQFWRLHNTAMILTLKTFALVNCVNTSTVPVEAPTRQQRRARERAGLPKVLHNTIVIGDTKRTKSEPKDTGIKMSQDIARGHFRHLTPPVGPFGRTITEPVTFWVPQHVRGSADVGEVVKDYVV